MSLSRANPELSTQELLSNALDSLQIAQSSSVSQAIKLMGARFANRDSSLTLLVRNKEEIYRQLINLENKYLNTFLGNNNTDSSWQKSSKRHQSTKKTRTRNYQKIKK